MLLLLAPSALATWTVLALDPETGEVGEAGATCGPFVWEVAALAPGHGAVAAQYATNLAGRDLAAQRLAEGATPEAILAELTGAAFADPELAARQYGVVAFSGDSAGYTGAAVEADAAEVGDAWVRAQGNTLRSTEVVEAAYAATAAGEGTLAERLLLGLEAGRDAGGDARCPAEAPAQSAFLHVATEADPVAVSLEAAPVFGGDPVAALRGLFDGGDTGCATGGGLPSAGVAVGAALLIGRRRGRAPR